MQPYIFPYIGYFQLINAVDVFVFYDDVNFIKKGWINRNQILVNEKANLFSVPLSKVSQNKLINEIKLAIDEKWIKQFYNTIEHSYRRAPFYQDTFELIHYVFEGKHQTIADLTIKSIEQISKYLNISTIFERSFEKYADTKGMEKADRLIKISQLCGASEYINPSGGQKLYNKQYFKKHHIDLFFIQNKIVSYPQFAANFVGGLSIIDVLMFNSKEHIKDMLTEYILV